MPDRKKRTDKFFVTSTSLPDKHTMAAKLYALVFEVREDKEGEYYHLVTL